MSLFINQPVKTFILACCGLIARLLILSTFKDQIRPRVEINTPVNSWKRAYEAVYLWNSGLDPYLGNMFHEYPINLQFYKIIISYFNVDIVFAATDVITSILLQQSTYNQLITNGQASKEAASSRSMKVLILYLFSPITILSCCGVSTAIFTNFLIAVISFILPLKPFRALTCVLCALLACNNIYYSVLILPIFLCLEYCSYKKQRSNGDNSNNNQRQQVEQYYEQKGFRESMLTSIGVCLVALITLLTTSYLLMNRSWTFLNSTYLYVLKIQDLTPNIGMFWYLFTEMFEHFLEFFTWVIQINAFIHFIPLSLCLRDNPFFGLYVIMVTSTISQPYPSLTNIGIITSLLPQWLDLVPHMKRGLIVTCAGITCMSLWPVFWHLWIMMGTANSNFYFGATLAFTVSLILFLIDLLSAHEIARVKNRRSEEFVQAKQSGSVEN